MQSPCPCCARVKRSAREGPCTLCRAGKCFRCRRPRYKRCPGCGARMLASNPARVCTLCTQKAEWRSGKPRKREPGLATPQRIAHLAALAAQKLPLFPERRRD